MYKLVNGNRRCSMAAVATIYSAAFLFCIINIPEAWYYDAQNYWKYGELLFADGFSLLNIPGWRGYVFPLYLGICNKLGGRMAFYAINSLLMAVLFAGILPELMQYRIDSAKKILKPVVSFGVIAVLFSGLFRYPLSDLFALFCGAVAVICLQKVRSANKIVGFTHVYAGLCGVFLYLSYNTRTIYLFLAVALMVQVVFLKNNGIEKLKIIVMMMLGSLLAAVPQITMNWHELGVFSPAVITDNLMLRQIMWGLQYQRYATFIGDPAVHASAKVCFMDPVGNALIQQEGIETFSSWGHFLSFFAKYPLELIGIYMRHFINMTLICWPEQYIADLNNNKIGYALICFVLFSLFLLALVANSIDKQKIWAMFPLLVPCICILPGAVESRFFVAMFLCVVMCLLYMTDWRKMLFFCKRNWFAVLVLTVVLGGFMISTWSGMLYSESLTPLFFR